MSSGGQQKHFEVSSHAPSETSESLGPGRACPGPLALPTRAATRVHPSHQSCSLSDGAAPSHPSCSLRDGTGLHRPGTRPGRAVPRPGAMASETLYLVERAAARGSVGSFDSALCTHRIRPGAETLRPEPIRQTDRRRMGWNEKLAWMDEHRTSAMCTCQCVLGVLLVLHASESDLLCRCVSVAGIGPACRSSESRIFVVADPPRPSRVRFWLGSESGGLLPGRLAKFSPPIRGHDPCFPTSGLQRRS